MHARMERELLWRHQIEGVRTLMIKGDCLWWNAKTPKEVGVGGVIKQKGVKALNIEIEVDDCEECTATFSFYVISGSNLSQVHIVVENLRATKIILDKGGWDRSMTSGDTSDRRCEGHNMSPSLDCRMMTSGDISGEGVRATIWAQVQTVTQRAETPQMEGVRAMIGAQL